MLRAAAALGAPPAADPCPIEPARVVIDQRIAINGDARVRVTLAKHQGPELLQVAEEGVDVAIEVQDAQGRTLAVADNPIARQGVQAIEIQRRSSAATLILRGKEHAGVQGWVRVYSSAPLRARAPHECLRFVRLMSIADALYASAVGGSDGASQTHSKDNSQSFTRALEAYRRVATGIGDVPSLGALRGRSELAVAAIYYYHLSDWAASAAWAERAAASAAAGADTYLRARAQALLGAAWIEMPNVDSRYENARKLFTEVASFHRSRAEPYDEALQVNNVGLAFYNESRFEEAVAPYTLARDAFDRLGETPRYALAIQNIALCQWGLGRWQAAAAAFSRALSLMQPEPYLDLYLLTLNNSALAHLAAGKFDDALSQHGRALALAERAGMSLEIARSYYGIGVTYYAMGDPSLARQYLALALALLGPQTTVIDGQSVIRQPDTRARLAALRALANLEQEAGNLEAADGYYREALTLATAPNVRARIELRLALSAVARGDLRAAESLAMPNAAGGRDLNQMTRATARVVRARILRAQGKLEEARAELAGAIATFEQYQALPDEFGARVEVARVLHQAGRRDQALQEIGRALEASEELRVQTANPVYRASVANEIRPALDLALQLRREKFERHLSGGRGAEADTLARESLQLADTSRARSLREFLAQSDADPGDPMVASLTAQRASLQRDLADRRYYLATREEKAQDDPSAQAMRADIARLRVSLANVESAFARLTSNRTPSRAERRTVRMPAQPGGMTVEYWIGAERAFAWVADAHAVSWVDLGDARAVESAARLLETSLSGYFRSHDTGINASIDSQARRLYDLVIRPFEKSLERTHSITLVPDGALHFVPFALLRDSRGAYLIERVAIRSVPALWVRASTRQSVEATQTGGRILLVADPVYQTDDARLGAVVAQVAGPARPARTRIRESLDPARLERLLGSASEAANVRALFDASRVDELRGLDAVRARVLERDLASYRFIHIAAHGSVDAESPALSSLVLGAFDRNGRVEDQQIRAGDLLGKRFAADVVVLSACNTSVGRSYAQEGPIGLHYAVLARGAKAVVASLWSVADETNTELMTEMYRRMIKQGERVDVALAGAMRAQLKAHPERDAALWAPYNTYVVE